MRWVVRVVEQKTNLEIHPFWLELLGYARLIDIHENSDNKQVFDIYPPTLPEPITNKKWAEDIALYMQRLGINAVAAPEWKDRETDVPETD